MEISASDGTTFRADQTYQIAPSLPLMDQWVKIEGIAGLRYVLQVILDTWRQGGDFQIIFTDDGKPGPRVTFERPKGHRNYAVEVLEVHPDA